MLVEKSEVKKRGSPKSRIRQNPYLQGGPFILLPAFLYPLAFSYFCGPQPGRIITTDRMTP